MSDNVFLDTNTVIYAYSLSDVGKQSVSSKLLLNNKCIVSTQVLNEYCNVCLKKFSMPVSEVLSDIDNILDNCGLIRVSETTIKRALFIQERHKYSYYDSLIIASAIESNCSVLYSEDLQHGHVIDGSLKIMNPFV
jgi:predicted nucleic acid-binding protein